MPKNIYYGSCKCDAMVKSTNEFCQNNAYYSANGSAGSVLYRCGVHCKSSALGNVKELPKDPHIKATKSAQLVAHAKSIISATDANMQASKQGKIICQKMGMMKAVELKNGYLNVFPNNKHQNRTDGFGCASLSPMQLGPVKHRQPGLPDALNIENYHQFNKVFHGEFTVDKTMKKTFTKDFYTTRRNGYLDPVPHRHKPRTDRPDLGHTDIPVCSVHKTLLGFNRQFTYLESRFFYCMAYESLAKQTADFKEVMEKHKNGVNLCICGYDAYPLLTKNYDEMTQKLYDNYLNLDRPFGHELVLVCLLALYKDDYPWRRFHRENKKVYANIAYVECDD